MQASFCASDAFQDMHIPVADVGSSSSAQSTQNIRLSEDSSASGWCRFGHWHASRCAVMGAGSRGVSGGAEMHHMEVAQELLLGAWKWHARSKKGDSAAVSARLHEVAHRIGFERDTVRTPSFDLLCHSFS